jgi:hypothetical protein
MSIYLFLCNPTDDFKDLTQQLPVRLLELSIDHREGRIPVAELVFPATESLPDQGWAYIATDDRGQLEPIFKGQFGGVAKTIDEQTKKICLYASPLDLQDAYQKHIESFSDNEFVASGKLMDYLEFTTLLPCYDRLGAGFILSDLFKGRSLKVLSNEILSGSLKIQLADTPLPAIEVSVIKEWTQFCRGETNLFPHIEAQFPQGRICTLSVSGLLASWPRTGQLLGRSGYAVVKSELHEFSPPRTGLLGYYPTKTPDINGQIYKINWLKGDLVVEWSYRQKRREILNFTIQNKNRYLDRSERPPRKIKLRLRQDDSNSSSASFFDTANGMKVASHAIDIAKSHLAYSSRALEVICQIPFEAGLDLTLDHEIKIVHPVIPDGEIQGKLVSYCLDRHYDKATTTLRILVGTGTGEQSHPIFKIHALSSISGLEDPLQLSSEQVIEQIGVHNHAFDQISMLKVDADQDLGTWIDLNLKDIRSKDVLERRYSIDDYTWSS